jgi:hypothetical protein
VVKKEHQMLAVGWIDNKAVHFISTADTTDIVKVTRRVGNKKVDVPAPVAVKNYNQFMGGVDRHDHLRSSFSLCKAHHFRKYYVKLFLFILDVGITNAWIYYKMCNGDNNKKYGTRADFFQSIAESMVSRTMNWSTMLEQEMSDNNKNNVSDGRSDNGGTSISIQYPTELCVPVPLHAPPVTISNKKKVCQSCNYEIRPFK